MEYTNFGNIYEIQARQVCTLRVHTTLSFSDRYVFGSIQSASVNPFRDSSCDLFQRADFKQIRLLMLFSNLAQVVDRRAFIGQN